MPLLFIGHGSPMNALQDNDFTRSLAAMGRRLGRPRAALAVSAHWFSRGTFVTAAPQPPQIYDFYGFPEELYTLRYEAPGAPDLAALVSRLGAAVPVRADARRGVDHGAWAVMRHLYPGADVPLAQLSIDGDLDEGGHAAVARRLLALRDEGVLVIASGNLVHNLGRISWGQFDPRHEPWAERFDAWVRDRIADRDLDALVRYRSLAPDGETAHPTDDHYLPLLYAMALVQAGDTIDFFHESMQHGSISMRCFIAEGA